MRVIATALVAWVNTCLVSAARGGNRGAKSAIAGAADRVSHGVLAAMVLGGRKVWMPGMP